MKILQADDSGTGSHAVRRCLAEVGQDIMVCLPPVTGVTSIADNVIGDTDGIQLRQQRPNVSAVGSCPRGAQCATITNHEPKAYVASILTDCFGEEYKISDGGRRKDYLGRVNGNIVKAAELLGVSRPTLYDLMHRLGLK